MTDKYTELLQKVDEEIEIAKRLIPVMAIGMIAIRKVIVEVMGDVEG